MCKYAINKVNIRKNVIGNSECVCDKNVTFVLHFTLFINILSHILINNQLI